MSILASYPSCGAALSFRPGTMVAVCAYCKALAARKDRDTALLGKVADLVDTGSPLGLGASGTYTGRSFTLAGRVQLKHPLGGVWDEWYLALDDGRWGWLAEAQGRFYLTFTQDPHGTLPSAGSLQAGGLADLGPAGLWTVGEISEATFHSAEGEIPWAIEPGATYRFADLSGRNGAFATLDYSEEPPLFFLGREIPLADLRIQGGTRKPPKVGTQGLNCPTCGGALALHAPDQTQRVGCPSCPVKCPRRWMARRTSMHSVAIGGASRMSRPWSKVSGVSSTGWWSRASACRWRSSSPRRAASPVNARSTRAAARR